MRLLTYNIHKGVGSDRRYRLERIIDVIQEQEPDLICLQEVDRNVRRSRFHDQPALIAENLGTAAHLYQLNVPKREGGYGNLILSRWPFRTQQQLSIRHRRCKPRGAQLVIVETPQGPLHLVNWHLGLREKERHWQVLHLLSHRVFLEAAHLPTIIAGDYNDWRNTLGKHHFTGHNFQQATAPIRRFRSFPSFLAMASLDKVFYRGGIHVRHAGIVRNRLARRASDHLPLVFDFHLANVGEVAREDTTQSVGQAF
ncbi:MAG TPA: endonuclease/exonuclease/phosphatase family protein [Gemmataceae bacterium]|nr:endonuclease/exonuclease/phosphatase family protein [Gemmataceae bacterium]